MHTESLEAQGSTMDMPHISLSASIYSKKKGQFAVIAVIEFTIEPYYPHVSLNNVSIAHQPLLVHMLRR
jgi:hypothetical protein